MQVDRALFLFTPEQRPPACGESGKNAKYFGDVLLSKISKYCVLHHLPAIKIVANPDDILDNTRRQMARGKILPRMGQTANLQRIDEKRASSDLVKT